MMHLTLCGCLCICTYFYTIMYFGTCLHNTLSRKCVCTPVYLYHVTFQLVQKMVQFEKILLLKGKGKSGSMAALPYF